MQYTKVNLCFSWKEWEGRDKQPGVTSPLTPWQATTRRGVDIGGDGKVNKGITDPLEC